MKRRICFVGALAAVLAITGANATTAISEEVAVNDFTRIGI